MVEPGIAIEISNLRRDFNVKLRSSQRSDPLKTLGPTEPGISEVETYSELPAFTKPLRVEVIAARSSRTQKPAFFLERNMGERGGSSKA